MDSANNNNNNNNNMNKLLNNSSKISIAYTFYHSIEVVWEELKDLGKWYTKQKLYKDFEVTKGKHSYEKGSQYKINYKGISFLYETKKVSEDDFSKQIVFECLKNSLNDIRFVIEYNIYKNTLQSSTVLTIDIQYFTNFGCAFLDIMKYEKIKLFKLNDKYLSKHRKYETEHVETCILKKNKKYVWDLLTDFKSFTKLIPGIADEVILNDEKLKLNSELILKYNKEEIEVPLKVNNYQNEDNKAIWKIGFTWSDINTIGKEPKKEFYIPFQEISYELIDIDCSKGDKSMLIFKHTFKEKEVTMDKLKDLKYNKIVIMKKLKNHCNKK